MTASPATTKPTPEERLLRSLMTMLESAEEAVGVGAPAMSRDRLHTVEKSLDDLLRVVREALEDPNRHTPSGAGTPGLLWDDPLSPILVEAIVALCDFVDVISKHLERNSPDGDWLKWGSHVFGAVDFRFISFIRLADRIVDPLGIPMLIGGAADNLLHAARALDIRVRGHDTTNLNRIQGLLSSIARGTIDYYVPDLRSAFDDKEDETIVELLSTPQLAFSTLRRSALSESGRSKDLWNEEQVVDLLADDAIKADVIRRNWGIEGEALKELKEEVGRGLLRHLRETEMIFELELLSGEVRYPAFQFLAGGIRQFCAELLKNALIPNDSWAICCWLQENLLPAYAPDGGPDDDLDLEGIAGSLRAHLTDSCRWKPDWNNDSTWHSLRNAVRRHDGRRFNPGSEGESLETFRITQQDFAPFYWAQIPADPDRDGPGGRFDLPRGARGGSLYMSKEVKGAWREVFDREPCLTLSDLLTRRLWTLTLKDGDLPFVDLMDMDAMVTATPERKATQRLARHFAGWWAETPSGEENPSRDEPKDLVRGMRVRLRTSSDTGYVLFGRHGAGLPAGSGLGLWSAESQNVMEHTETWQSMMWLLNRDRTQPGQTIVLQRFPTDIVRR